MPASRAACQIVVPSGTSTSRPSMVSWTVRTSVGASMEIATVPRSVVLMDEYVQSQVVEVVCTYTPLGVEAAGRVVAVDHRAQALGGQRRRAPGGHGELLGEEALGQPVVG